MRALLLLFLVACEPFVLESRFPRFVQYAGDCGIRTDGVLGCPRLVASLDENRADYLVYDSPAETPKLMTLASGSAGRDGCAVTAGGDAFCFGALEGAPLPEGAPFSALAVRRNGVSACALSAKRTIDCAGALGVAPPGTYASLGGFMADTAFALDDSGAIVAIARSKDALAPQSPSPLAKLTCEDDGCAALATDGAIVCFDEDGAAERYEAETFIDIARVPGACCGLRPLGDVVCVGARDRLNQVREYTGVRFAEIRYVPSEGLCGATVGGAGACTSVF